VTFDFDKLLGAFDEYYRLQDKLNAGRFNDHGIELRKRLLQLRFLLSKCQSLDQDINSLRPASAGDRELMQRGLDAMDEQETYAETFYWIAWRCRQAIRQMPGLKSFDPVGIREVRNKLLEHPEAADSGVIFGGFGTGGEMGPVVKAMRYDDQKDLWKDRGLYVNAKEFADEMHRALSALLL
jgi:hypothetical protein